MARPMNNDPMPVEEMERGEEIILTVRQEIGRVGVSPYGNTPAIPEAFRIAGVYISEQTVDGPGFEPVVEFEFHGHKFTASAERVEDRR
jgi:hypothetical protein